MKKNQMLAFAAADLSNFDGDDDISAGQFLSPMAGDDLVDMYGEQLVGYKGIKNPFKGSLAKKAAKDGGRVFKLTVTNGVASDNSFYLNPSYLISATTNGHPLSGKGITGEALTFTGSPGTSSTAALQNLYNYLLYNPQIAISLRITSTVASQMDEAISVTYLDPFKASPVANSLFISSYVDENTYQDKRATIDEALPFDNQTQIIVPIKASSTMTITIFFGPAINLAQVMRQVALGALKG